MSNQKRTTKAYNYRPDIDLTDDKYSFTIVKDVPCYNLNDINKLLGTKYYSSLDFARFYQKAGLTIQTGNHHGATHYYVYASPEIDKLVHEQTLFAIIKNNIKKPPKRHIKKLHVCNRGDIMIANKQKATYVQCYIINDNDYYKFDPVDAE
jgi:hypothetical protein